ncbi:MAG TPA: GNAT family N-acetyltransferase [Vicinamibacterales bacterium]|nr:GNAT family N-acetyltransferase [Vicinamibacterales bacterium]
MTIVDLSAQPLEVRRQAAAILAEAFPDENGWPTIELGLAEIDWIVGQNGFVRAAIDDNAVLGWVGGLPEYRGRVWELHPIVVDRARRLHGVGRALVLAFEDEARKRGGLTATLGTDDHFGQTSLSDVDLYTDLPGCISGLRDRGTRHPFLFYRRLGYVVTGLMPDANGRGKPDIYMSKKL